MPRFDAVAILQGLDCGGAIAVMDTSDGLADAVIQICTQSGVGAALLRSTLPIPPGLVEAVGRSTAERWTLYGGEDFELVLSLPTAVASDFIRQLPGSQAIGYTTPEPEIRLVNDLDPGADIRLEQSQGNQHFG